MTDDERGKPWFCVVSLEAPHPPYEAPAPGVVRREPAEIVLPANVPRGGEVEAKARRELAGYYAHIEATDRAMGGMLAKLDERRARSERRGSLVVFTSVHGDMHGAHGLFRKGWPHEESVRVPLLVRGIGGVGRRDEAVSLLDLAAWTRAWARGETAVIDRRYSTISMPSVVALPHQCDRRWRGVRTKTRKLALNEDGTPWLFFDLENDPLEMRNLVGETAAREEMAEMRARVLSAL